VRIFIWLKGKRMGRELTDLRSIHVYDGGAVQVEQGGTTMGHWPSDTLTRHSVSVTRYVAGEIRKIEFVREKP